MDGTRASRRPSPAVCLVAAVTVALAAAIAMRRPAAADPAPLAKAAQLAYDGAKKKRENGQATAESVYTWSVRWLDAERESLRGRAKATAFKAHLDRMAELDERTRIMVDVGTATSLDALDTRYYRLEAERWLARKKR